MTVTRLAWHPREHARTLDVLDDRIQEEGALQLRFVPLRVHEGGVHEPVQELLVEQDAADVPRCGSTQNRLFRPESAVLIIVFNPSSVLVTVRVKKITFLGQILQSNHCGRFTRIRRSFAGSRLCLAGNLGENKKLRFVIIITPMVMVSVKVLDKHHVMKELVGPAFNKAKTKQCPERTYLESRGKKDSESLRGHHED